jgi:hypothetical protein
MYNDFGFGVGVGEACAECVKWEPRVQWCWRASVAAIADDRVTDVTEMLSYLVHPPGFRPERYQREIIGAVQ